MINPFVIGAVGVECFVGSQSNSRIVFSECRNGVIEMEKAVVIRNIRRSDAPCSGYLLGCSPGKSIEDVST
jgi:hypothetical protein